jgi:putative redox protein
MTRKPNHVRVNWAGDHRFDAGRPGGPTMRIDADGETGPGPVDTLLNALASCTAVDVVDILAKRRTPIESMSIEVLGERFDGIPRRLTHVRLVYKIHGADIDRVHAERAIELAVTKYCSVRDSLDPKIPVEWALELNGDGNAIAETPAS